MLRNIVSRYIQHGSSVFACFLGASKPFDLVRQLSYSTCSCPVANHYCRAFTFLVLVCRTDPPCLQGTSYLLFIQGFLWLQAWWSSFTNSTLYATRQTTYGATPCKGWVVNVTTTLLVQKTWCFLLLVSMPQVFCSLSASLLLEIVSGLRFNQISIRFDLFGSNVAVLLP